MAFENLAAQKKKNLKFSRKKSFSESDNADIKQVKQHETCLATSL